jgi:copper chaperone CopZ
MNSLVDSIKKQSRSPIGIALRVSDGVWWKQGKCERHRQLMSIPLGGIDGGEDPGPMNKTRQSPHGGITHTYSEQHPFRCDREVAQRHAPMRESDTFCVDAISQVSEVTNGPKSTEPLRLTAGLSHCVSAVAKEVTAIEGVSGVEISLVSYDLSTATVTSGQPVALESIRTAVEGAGDELVGDSR